MIYKHTQIGYLILFVLFFVLLDFGFVLTKTGIDPLIVSIMLFVVFILISFVSLQVTINKKDLKIKFGYGIFKKSFPLKEIVSAKVVKNRWYYGWGIRVWLWPKTCIFNISGFDAVEIKMKDGKLYRIGTDDSTNLEHVLKQEIK
jgi:hypothetical protein